MDTAEFTPAQLAVIQKMVDDADAALLKQKPADDAPEHLIPEEKPADDAPEHLIPEEKPADDVLEQLHAEEKPADDVLEQLHAEIDAADAAREGVPDDKYDWDNIATVEGYDDHGGYGINQVDIYRCSRTDSYGYVERSGCSCYDGWGDPVVECSREEAIEIMRDMSVDGMTDAEAAEMLD